MTLYEFVALAADRADVQLTHSAKEKIVGSLKVAGFENLKNEKDRQTAFIIVSKRIAKIIEIPKLRKASIVTAASPKSGASAFEAIKEMRDKGICPKCKTDKNVSYPKIRKGEEVMYCSTCRAVLWKD